MKRFALILAVLAAPFALAGDEPRQQVAYTGTQGCTTILRPNTRYSVQPTTDAYVRVTNDTTNAPATSTVAVKITADKLYDVFTTTTKRYVCCIQVSAGGTCKLFEYEDGSKP